MGGCSMTGVVPTSQVSNLTIDEEGETGPTEVQMNLFLAFRGVLVSQ